MKHRLLIQIDSPRIEEYHDVLHHIQQQVDLGFMDGSDESLPHFEQGGVNFKWHVRTSPTEGIYFEDGTSIYDDPLA